MVGRSPQSVYSLYIQNKIVLDEVAQGDAEIAGKRLEILKEIQLLELNQTVEDLGMQFLDRSDRRDLIVTYGTNSTQTNKFRGVSAAGGK